MQLKHTDCNESWYSDEIYSLGVSRQVGVVTIALQKYDHYPGEKRGSKTLCATVQQNTGSTEICTAVGCDIGTGVQYNIFPKSSCLVNPLIWDLQEPNTTVHTRVVHRLRI